MELRLREVAPSSGQMGIDLLRRAEARVYRGGDGPVVAVVRAGDDGEATTRVRESIERPDHDRQRGPPHVARHLVGLFVDVGLAGLPVGEGAWIVVARPERPVEVEVVRLVRQIVVDMGEQLPARTYGGVAAPSPPHLHDGPGRSKVGFDGGADQVNLVVEVDVEPARRARAAADQRQQGDRRQEHAEEHGPGYVTALVASRSPPSTKEYGEGRTDSVGALARRSGLTLPVPLTGGQDHPHWHLPPVHVPVAGQNCPQSPSSTRLHGGNIDLNAAAPASFTDSPPQARPSLQSGTQSVLEVQLS